MARLDPKDGDAVLINTSHAPERAEELMTVPERTTRQTIRFQPGYVSANRHPSTDRTPIVNGARWRSRVDFEAMLRDPAAAPSGEAAKVATSFDPVIFELGYSDSAEAAR
jgi:hypothetical protein